VTARPEARLERECRGGLGPGGSGNPALNEPHLTVSDLTIAESERDQARFILYALSALAATLALVPRERVCWVVKSGNQYLGAYTQTPWWTANRRNARRFAIQDEAYCRANNLPGRVVRLRVRGAL
jgi:hypothetical protein